MCEQLQVSRPVLREVIRALCYMGYLTSVQGGGIYVCEPTGPFVTNLRLQLALERIELMEIWELRYVLEVAIAGMAAERATEDEINDIWNACHIYEQQVVAGDDEDRTIDATQEFHNVIAKAAHNEVMMSMLANVSDMLVMSRKVSIRVPGSSIRAMNFHTKISQAVSDRDVELVKSIMAEHLMDVKSDLMISLDEMEKDQEKNN